MLKELVFKIGADTTEFVKSIAVVNKSIEGLSTSFQKVGDIGKNAFQSSSDWLQKNGESWKNFGEKASTYISLPLLAGAGASIKFASDMQESLNKVNVAFGESATQVVNWSKNSVNSMGLASGSALEFASTFGDMATSMGLSQSASVSMSTSLVQLGADLASFKNIPIEQAMGALNGVFTGETESLKMLGVVMTEAQLKAFALSKGIQTNVDKMSQAQLVTLRYQYVLEMTKNAQGDFARTSDGSANQMRIFGETLKQIGVSIGDILLPYFNMTILAVNNWLKSFMTLDDGAKKIIVTIGVMAIAIPPLIFAVGLLGTSLTGVTVAVRGLGVALKFLVTNPIGLAITALVSLGTYFYVVEGSWEKFSDAVEKTWIKLKLIWENVWYSLKSSFYEAEISMAKGVIKLLNILKSAYEFFGISTENVDKSIAKMQAKIDSIDNKKFNFAMQSMVDATQNLDRLQELNYKQEKLRMADLMANHDYFTQSIADMASKAGAKAIQDRQIADEAKKMADEQKKLIEDMKKSTDGLSGSTDKLKDSQQKLAEQLEQTKQKAYQSADALGNAISTALSNRQKIQEDAMKKLSDQIDVEKKKYTDLVNVIKNKNAEIISSIKNRFKETVKQAEDEYNSDQSITKDKYKSLIDAQDEKINAIYDANKKEIDAENQKQYELKKSNIEENFYYLSAIKDRAKVVQEYSDLIANRQASLLDQNQTLSYEYNKDLTDSENKAIKDRLMAQRDARIALLEQNKKDLMAQEQTELDARALKYENFLKQQKDYQDRSLLSQQFFYASELTDAQNETSAKLKELNIQLQNLKDHYKAITDMQIEVKNQVDKGQSSIVELLKTYNPQWQNQGQSFGQSLIDGLNSKKQSIKQAVDSLLFLTQSQNQDVLDQQKKNTQKQAVKKVGFDFNAIPMMANGGIVNSPTLAWIGEGRQSEAVIPLNRLADMTSRDTHIYLDSREITRAIAPNMVDQIRSKLGVNY